MRLSVLTTMDQRYKIAVYVPKADAEKVKRAGECVSVFIGPRLIIQR